VHDAALQLVAGAVEIEKADLFRHRADGLAIHRCTARIDGSMVENLVVVAEAFELLFASLISWLG
jgi:hypothetical protein